MQQSFPLLSSSHQLLSFRPRFIFKPSSFSVHLYRFCSEVLRLLFCRLLSFWVSCSSFPLLQVVSWLLSQLEHATAAGLLALLVSLYLTASWHLGRVRPRFRQEGLLLHHHYWIVCFFWPSSLSLLTLIYCFNSWLEKRLMFEYLERHWPSSLP